MIDRVRERVRVRVRVRVRIRVRVKNALDLETTVTTELSKTVTDGYFKINQSTIFIDAGTAWLPVIQFAEHRVNKPARLCCVR